MARSILARSRRATPRLFVPPERRCASFPPGGKCLGALRHSLRRQRMTIKVAINGYGRIGRNILRAHYEGGQEARSRDRRDQRPRQSRDQRASDALRHGARQIPRQDRGRRRRDGRQRRPDQGLRAAQSRRAAVGALGVDVVLECTGLVHDQGKGVGASEGRREEGDHLRARRQGCRRDHRLRRQPRHAQGRRTRSSPTRRARPTAWRRWSSRCTTRSASSTG